MASLSNLLNPAPAEGEPTPARKDSLPPLQIPDNPYTQQTAQGGQGQSSDQSSNARDAAQALAALSSTTATPSNRGLHRASGSTPQNDYRVSDGRRASAYGETTGSQMTSGVDDLVRRSSSGSHDRYQPSSRSPDAQMLRKMSSPTLHQYHMSSRSPEHMRRLSMVENPDPNFKLPPLHASISPQSFPQPAQSYQPTHSQTTTTDDKISPQQYQTTVSARPTDEKTDFVDQQPPPKAESPKSFYENVSPAHFPAYTPPQPRAPSDNASGSNERQSSTTPVKSEATTSMREPIPAFVPVPSVKREQTSASQTPARETSVPVPTTEDMGVGESRGTKRPAPKSGTKKGVAKKGPPAKKQKTAPTPAKARPKSKTGAKKAISASATPLDSSPAPRSARGDSSIGRSSASPSGNAFSEDEEQGDEEDMGTPDPDSDVYCICRKPDTGTFMIGCDGGCDDWFHGKCVGIQEKDKNLIDRYICPNCQKKSEKNGKEVVTTWKRMCRKPGCRMPARLAKKDEEPSKYCSDSCGVEFFRDMMGRTRGASEMLGTGKKHPRKKAGTSEEGGSVAGDDPGPRGGLLNNRELKALVTSVSTFEDFKRLGDGVLSPPATPSPTTQKAQAAYSTLELDFNEGEKSRLAEIATLKDDLRSRYTLLKDQAKFVGILRQTAQRIAEVKGMKVKDICGYDDRVRMDERAFAAWRESSEGQTILKSSVIDIDVKDEDGDAEMNGADNQKAHPGPCVNPKRKCTKHFDWTKLALETNRFEISENSDRMRQLDGEEKEIKARAGLRARQIKAGEVGGTVEVHSPSVDGVAGPAESEAVVDSAEKLASMGIIEQDVSQGATPAAEPTDHSSGQLDRQDAMDVTV